MPRCRSSFNAYVLPVDRAGGVDIATNGSGGQTWPPVSRRTSSGQTTGSWPGTSS